MKTEFLTEAIIKKKPNATSLEIEALKGQINDPEVTLKNPKVLKGLINDYGSMLIHSIKVYHKQSFVTIVNSMHEAKYLDDKLKILCWSL